MRKKNKIFEANESEKINCDIISRLLRDRIIMINGEINDEMVPIVCSQILYLDGLNSSKTIFLYINSPGGSVSSGLAIYDTMQFVRSPISTICLGIAMSMGAFLLATGTRGFRFSLPHAQILIHQPLAGFQGQITDIEIHTKQLTSFKKTLNELLASHTGQEQKILAEMTERDRYLTPDEALQLGMIDGILRSKDDIATFRRNYPKPEQNPDQVEHEDATQ